MNSVGKLGWLLGILSLYSVYRRVYTAYSVWRTLYTVQWTTYTIQCTPYNVRHTVYIIQCTTYSVHHTMYDIHCTSYNVRHTLYIKHNTHSTEYYTPTIMIQVQVHFLVTLPTLPILSMYYQSRLQIRDGDGAGDGFDITHTFGCLTICWPHMYPDIYPTNHWSAADPVTSFDLYCPSSGLLARPLLCVLTINWPPGIYVS